MKKILSLFKFNWIKAKEEYDKGMDFKNKNLWKEALKWFKLLILLVLVLLIVFKQIINIKVVGFRKDIARMN